MVNYEWLIVNEKQIFVEKIACVKCGNTHEVSVKSRHYFVQASANLTNNFLSFRNRFIQIYNFSV